MTRSLRCAVCGANGRVPPEATGEPVESLRWLCGAHSRRLDALLGRGGA